MKNIVIIGAGIGGLCTGIQLLIKGYSVDIYEKNSTPGGVLKSIASPDAAYRFEESASISINPQLYKDFFKSIGLNFNDYFSSTKLKNLYNVYFNDGTQITIPRNISILKDSMSWEDYNSYAYFIYKTEQKYLLAKSKILTKSFFKAKPLLNKKFIKTFINLHTLTSANSYINNNIKSSKLRKIVKFQSFFMGVPIRSLPNIYASVASNSQLEGIDHIEGGLSYFVQTLAKIFQDKGGRIIYNSPVERIETKGSNAIGVWINNLLLSYNKIIVNCDFSHSQQSLLNRLNLRLYSSSCSTFIVHLGLKKLYPDLNVHNLYISDNFQQELENIDKDELPMSPSLYIYSPSFIDKTFTKNPNHSVINIMVRVPNLKSLPLSWDALDTSYMYKQIMISLSKISAFQDIKENIKYVSFTTPKDFKEKYNCKYGSCFGISHTFFQSMIFRPPVKDKKIKNLYYTGTSIHPGNGASIVMNGSSLTANELN